MPDQSSHPQGHGLVVCVADDVCANGRHFTLKQATRLKQLQKDGRPVHVATLHRWRLRGVRGVRLRTWLVGGVRVTTESAVNEFLERLNNPGLPPDAPTPSDRARQIAAAERELELAGFGANPNAKSRAAHAAIQGVES